MIIPLLKTMNLLSEIEKGTRSAAMKKKIIGYYLITSRLPCPTWPRS